MKNTTNMTGRKIPPVPVDHLDRPPEVAVPGEAAHHAPRARSVLGDGDVTVKLRGALAMTVHHPGLPVE